MADGLVPFAEGTDGGGSIRIPAAWCGVYGFKAVVRPQCRWSCGPNAFGGATPFMCEGPISRTVEDAALALTALAGYDARDPFSLESDEDFAAGDPPLDQGLRRSPTAPTSTSIPVDPEVRAVVDEAVEVFAEAGATVEEVKLGLKRNQRELSDAWCRLIAPLNIAGLEGMKAAGIDLLGEHRDDFPPEYLHWIDVGQKLSALDVVRDQAIRTEVYDAIQGVLAAHQILVSPTLACMPVDNAHRRQHHGPDRGQRRRGRPADRLVPDLFHQLQRPPVGLGAGGPQRRLAGRHADHRPPLRRRRRARRGGSIRTPAAVARPLSHLCRTQALGGRVFATAQIVHRWVRSDGNFEYVSVAARIT